MTRNGLTYADARTLEVATLKAEICNLKAQIDILKAEAARKVEAEWPPGKCWDCGRFNCGGHY